MGEAFVCFFWQKGNINIIFVIFLHVYRKYISGAQLVRGGRNGGGAGGWVSPEKVPDFGKKFLILSNFGLSFAFKMWF